MKYATKQLAAKTLETYLVLLKNRILPYFGDRLLGDIKTIHVVNFMNTLQDNHNRLDGKEGHLSSASVQYVYRVLRNVLQRAVEWQLIKSNPAVSTIPPKVKHKKPSVFDEKEITSLFLALESEKLMWRIMITIAVTTGLRRGELLGLEWKHIDLDSGVVDINQALVFAKGGGYIIKEPKTANSNRKIALPSSLLADLKSYKHQWNKDRLKSAELWSGGQYSFVFCSWHGKPLYPSSIGTWWRRFTKRHALRYIRFHDLRHTSATLLINQGLHAKIISARLGHSDIRTTMNIYGHTLREADQQAATLFEKLLSQVDNKQEKKA